MNQQNFELAKKALIGAGLSGSRLNYALIQVAHETGGFNSRVQKENNNLSGIKFAKQKNATPGLMSPEKNRYANFATITDWANAYVYEVNKKARPLDTATSLSDFALKLKQNGYYTDTVTNYTKALASWERQLAKQLGIVAPPAKASEAKAATDGVATIIPIIVCLIVFSLYFLTK